MAKAYGVSAFLHFGAVAILAVYSAQEFQEPTRFHGQRHVIYAEWSAPPSPEIPPPVSVDPSPVVERVLIRPQQAEIEQHRFVHTPAREVPQSELLPMLDLPAPDITRPPPAKVERSVEGESRDQPEVQTTPPRPLERTAQYNQPPATASAAAAVPLVTLGTDSTTPVSFANNAPPRYPEQARRNRWEGTVLLELTVAESGDVVDVRVVESSGHAILDAAAVTAIRQWKGEPARRGGKTVVAKERLPVRFRL